MNPGEEFFESRVLPDLKTSLVKLIDHVLKSDEVRKHKERLKELQVLNKLEQKNIEKEKLKVELGSDYESSSEDSMLEELEFIKSESQEESEAENFEGSEISKQETFSKVNESMNEKEKAQRKKMEMKRMTQILLKKKEEKPFNPLYYLGQLLKEIDKSKREDGNMSHTKQKKKTVKIIEEPKPVLELEDISNASP